MAILPPLNATSGWFIIPDLFARSFSILGLPSPPFVKIFLKKQKNKIEITIIGLFFKYSIVWIENA